MFMRNAKDRVRRVPTISGNFEQEIITSHAEDPLTLGR